MTPARSSRTRDDSDEDRRRIGEEIASRLRHKGIRLSGSESSDELADLEEAVEDFERAVERAGGDLMVDEPVAGGTPIAPDNSHFVLPARKPSESVHAFLERIHDAAERFGQT